jgi:hypothetical protein
MLGLLSESNAIQGDAHPLTSSSPTAEPTHTSYEPPNVQDTTPTNESPHPQALPLNDLILGANSQRLAISEPPSLPHNQGCGHVIEDFNLPLGEDLSELFNELEDTPIFDDEWNGNNFGNDSSDYLMNYLEGELENPPPAGVPFKNHSDRIKGLDVPARPD